MRTCGGGDGRVGSHGGADLTRRRIAERPGEPRRVYRRFWNWQNVDGSLDGACIVFAQRDCDQRFGGDFGTESDWRIRGTRAQEKMKEARGGIFLINEAYELGKGSFATKSWDSC